MRDRRQGFLFLSVSLFLLAVIVVQSAATGRIERVAENRGRVFV